MSKNEDALASLTEWIGLVTERLEKFEWRLTNLSKGLSSVDSISLINAHSISDLEKSVESLELRVPDLVVEADGVS